MGAVLLLAEGDPLALARLGTRYAHGLPDGTEGYDGQFIYYLARQPWPHEAAPHLDVPAYRYQRILLPLLAHGLALGSAAAVPWVLAALGLLAQSAGTWIVSELLATWGVSRWYALIYGLWAGFTLAVRLDLPEPLAYGLAAAALLSAFRGRQLLCALLYGLAAFAKEVTLVFALAHLASALLDRQWRFALRLLAVGILPFAVFQAWLWWIFGQPGLSSGGAYATSFELVPYLGLLRIGQYSPLLLAGSLVVFGPTVVAPSLWGLWRGLADLFRRQSDPISLGLLLNAAAVALLPFSTFREPGGLLRVSSGLVLALLLYAAHRQDRRVLRYSWFFLVLNVFLLK